LPGLDAATSARTHRIKLIACFAVVYLVWGSSYLAMRVGVQQLAPMLFAGVRFALAGVLLVGFAAARGARVPFSGREWKHILIMGVLTVLVSNGINNWAIQWVPSNQSALLNATSAFWIAGSEPSDRAATRSRLARRLASSSGSWVRH
jgi:drug/metabolite transporter (DMT)-like permease